MLKKLIGRLRSTFFRIMIKENDKLIPIEIKTPEGIQTYYMNETEYERNRLYYENRLDNWYNFLD